MGCHVPTAIICNEANETPTGSTVKIDEQKRGKLIKELSKRSERAVLV